MFRLLDKCRIDEKIALLYTVIAASFSQVSYMLYPRIMPISDMIAMSDENPWGYVHGASNQIVKPVAVPCKYSKFYS